MRIKEKSQTRKTAQDIQDDIFKKMTADKKLKVGSQLWQLARDLVGDKINYGTDRPKTSFNKYRQNS